jgi:hypothetical protein
MPEALLFMDWAIVGILTRLELLQVRTHRRSGGLEMVSYNEKSAATQYPGGGETYWLHFDLLRSKDD